MVHVKTVNAEHEELQGHGKEEELVNDDFDSSPFHVEQNDPDVEHHDYDGNPKGQLQNFHFPLSSVKKVHHSKEGGGGN